MADASFVSETEGASPFGSPSRFEMEVKKFRFTEALAILQNVEKEDKTQKSATLPQKGINSRDFDFSVSSSPTGVSQSGVLKVTRFLDALFYEPTS
jgi:hypothetical protein